MNGKVDFEGHLKAIDEYWDIITKNAAETCGSNAMDIAFLYDFVKRIKTLDGIDTLARVVYNEDCEDERILLAYYFGFLCDSIRQDKSKLSELTDKSEAQKIGVLVDKLINAMSATAKALMFDPDK